MTKQNRGAVIEVPSEADSMDITIVADTPTFGVPRLGNVEPGTGPAFKVSEVGELFFNRTAFWVRWLEKNNKHILSTDPNCPHLEAAETVNGKVTSTRSWISPEGVCTHCGGVEVSTARTETGYRVYFLPDIERLVYAYLSNGSISPAQAMLANELVQTLAKIHGLAV